MVTNNKSSCPLISVVMPGLNEEENVKTAVDRCTKSLEDLKVHFELILVNDGSTDRTGEIITELSENDKRIIPVHNPVNIGVGSSVLIGAKVARGEYVLFESMDLPLDPGDIRLLLPHLPEVDILVYERTDRSAHSIWRKVTSWTHNSIVNLLFRPGVADLNFAQIYRREFIDSTAVKSRSPAFVTPELIIRGIDSGAKIVRCATKFHPRSKGQANFGKPRDILWTLGDMVAFWFERRRNKGR